MPTSPIAETIKPGKTQAARNPLSSHPSCSLAIDQTRALHTSAIDAHARLLDVAVGVSSVAIVYESVRPERVVIELIEIDSQKRGVKSNVLHMPLPECRNRKSSWTGIESSEQGVMDPK